jgi:hypothetical protein
MESVELVPYDHVVFTEFEGGEGVLVDLDTKKYFQLNETAMFVWRRLEKGLGVADIAGELAAEYDVTPERAAESVRRLLENLRSFKLVQARA